LRTFAVQLDDALHGLGAEEFPQRRGSTPEQPPGIFAAYREEPIADCVIVADEYSPA
jgi:hypothetical protein